MNPLLVPFPSVAMKEFTVAKYDDLWSRESNVWFPGCFTVMDSVSVPPPTQLLPEQHLDLSIRRSDSPHVCRALVLCQIVRGLVIPLR